MNDRGKPLSDTDIFKAQFYKYYSDQGRKEEFITRWKELEVLCEDIFDAPSVLRWMSCLQGTCIMRGQNRE